MPGIKHWLWYWLQLPGCPFGSRPDDADVIIVPAFGRNELADDDLANLRRWHDEHGADDVTTLNWCWGRDLDVGDPNRALGMLAIAAAHSYHIPIIAQWEVIVACPSDWYARHRSRITCLWPPDEPGRGYNSLDVLTDMVVAMTARGCRHPLLLAHAGHAMRFAMLTRGMINAWPAVYPDLPEDFDPDSVQWQTRNRLAWGRYQIMACGHHVLHRLV